MWWRRETGDDAGIPRLRQWAEINIAALHEAHRQHKQRLYRTENRVREIEARVRALEEQPPAWSYTKQVEL